MEPRLASALVTTADWFDEHQILFGVCGSAMLSLLGLEVEVGDIDVAVPGDARPQLDAVPWPRLEPKESSPLFSSDWLERFDVDGTTLECIGSMRILLEGRYVDVPFEGGPVTTVEGREITLVRPEVWYHVYRVYRPERADILGALIGSHAIADGGRILGL